MVQLTRLFETELAIRDPKIWDHMTSESGRCADRSLAKGVVRSAARFMKTVLPKKYKLPNTTLSFTRIPTHNAYRTPSLRSFRSLYSDKHNDGRHLRRGAAGGSEQSAT